MLIILNETENVLAIDEPLLLAIEREYMQLENIPDRAEIGLTFVDDDTIWQLNLEHRKIDKATDVLSFPMYEKGEVLEEETILFGDVVISLNHAEVQAKLYQHSIEREIAYLFVHGLLHLAGYDHMTDVDKEEMRCKEELILDKVGIFRHES